MIKIFRLNLLKKGRLVIPSVGYTKPLMTNPDIYIAEQRIKKLVRRKERS